MLISFSQSGSDDGGVNQLLDISHLQCLDQAYDGDSGDDAAGNGSEATVLNAVPFQLMQRDETSCKGDPASVEEWITLIETISTLVLDGGNDVRERVAEKSGRHCDVFSPMVDLSLRCQEFRNRYEEERQRREKLDAGILEHSKEVHTLQNEIERLKMAAAERETLQYDEERKRREELDVGNLEHSKEVHMLQNEIERLQMAAAERERMPPLGDSWGIWQREVRRADEEKKRADEERQLVKELTAEIREAERKLGYYKSKYYGLSSQRTTTRGDSSGCQGHFSEHLEDPRE